MSINWDFLFRRRVDFFSFSLQLSSNGRESRELQLNIAKAEGLRDWGRPI